MTYSTLLKFFEKCIKSPNVQIYVNKLDYA